MIRLKKILMRLFGVVDRENWIRPRVDEPRDNHYPYFQLPIPPAPKTLSAEEAIDELNQKCMNVPDDRQVKLLQIIAAAAVYRGNSSALHFLQLANWNTHNIKH